jgi:hypothetical protein
MLLWNFSNGNAIADFFTDYSLYVLLLVLICGIFLLFYFVLLLVKGGIRFYTFLINVMLIVAVGLAMFLLFVRKVNLHC